MLPRPSTSPWRSRRPRKSCWLPQRSLASPKGSWRFEPNRLFITGKIYDNKEEKGKKTLYTERVYNQIFRYVDLPIAVNPNDGTATVKDGVLKITLYKAQAPKLIPVTTVT